MRAALVVVLIGALALSGCGRLRDDSTPTVAPSPSASQPSGSELAPEVDDLLDEATTSLDQVTSDLRTGDDAAEKE